LIIWSKPDGGMRDGSRMGQGCRWHAWWKLSWAGVLDVCWDVSGSVRLVVWGRGFLFFCVLFALWASSRASCHSCTEAHRGDIIFPRRCSKTGHQTHQLHPSWFPNVGWAELICWPCMILCEASVGMETGFINFDYWFHFKCSAITLLKIVSNNFYLSKCHRRLLAMQRITRHGLRLRGSPGGG